MENNKTGKKIPHDQIPSIFWMHEKAERKLCSSKLIMNITWADTNLTIKCEINVVQIPQKWSGKYARFISNEKIM